MNERRHPEVRLAADTLPGKPIAAIGLGVIAFGLLLVGLAALLLADARKDLGAPPPAVPRAAPERLAGIFQSPLPGGAGLELRREGEERLARWAWVDRGRGVVRLPIEVAIELLLAGQVPAGVAAPPAAATPPTPDTGTDPRGTLGRDRGGLEGPP